MARNKIGGVGRKIKCCTWVPGIEINNKITSKVINTWIHKNISTRTVKSVLHWWGEVTTEVVDNCSRTGFISFFVRSIPAGPREGGLSSLTEPNGVYCPAREEWTEDPRLLDLFSKVVPANQPTGWVRRGISHLQRSRGYGGVWGLRRVTERVGLYTGRGFRGQRTSLDCVQRVTTSRNTLF